MYTFKEYLAEAYRYISKAAYMELETKKDFMDFLEIDEKHWDDDSVTLQFLIDKVKDDYKEGQSIYSALANIYGIFLYVVYNFDPENPTKVIVSKRRLTEESIIDYAKHEKVTDDDVKVFNARDPFIYNTIEAFKTKHKDIPCAPTTKLSELVLK